MSDLDKNAPSEGNRGTLEDLMEAAIDDAEKEKVVDENVEEIPKDGNQEKDIEEKTTNNVEGDDTAHSQKDENEADKNNKEDNDDLEERKRTRKTEGKMRNLRSQN